MSETHSAMFSNPKFLLQALLHYSENEKSSLKENEWREGSHCIENLAQDQYLIRLKCGSKIDTYRGRFVETDEDTQSDYNSISFSEQEDVNFVLNWLNQYLQYKIMEDSALANEELISEEKEQEEQLDEYTQIVDTGADDISKLNSEQLVSAILDPKTESDIPRLRELILIAEDTDFTVEESQQLAPRLLDFAEKYRNSNDPQDETVVWSAIRTGASMLRPDETECLRPLLEPGYSIETTLVTVKMIGRIFEAQPPEDVDRHTDLANEVFQISESLLNQYAIGTSSKSGALAQLAIYALAGMASSQTQKSVEKVKQLGVTWFTQQTLGELRKLRNAWSNQSIAEEPQELLDKIIQTLE